MYFFICGLIIVVFILYYFAVKPYFQIFKLKKAFELKGYKVLVEPLNFLKQQVIEGTIEDLAKHNDATWRFKHTYKQYDITLKNSLNKIYVSINKVQLLQDIFKNIQKFEKPSVMIDNSKRLYGAGIALSQGNQWKKKRKLYSEIFNFKLLEEIQAGLVQTVEKSINQWQTEKQINLMNQNRTIFFNLFVIAYFGRLFDQFNYKGKSYSSSMIDLVDQLYKQSFTWKNLLFGSKFLAKGFTASDRQTEQLLQAVLAQTKEYIEKRYIEMKNNKQNQNNILSKVVFNSNLQNLSEQQKYEMLKQITGDVIGLFVANTDTGSSALTSTLHLLTKNPIILQKLIEEQDIFNKDYSSSSMKNLKYMDGVFNEILRLYGPANWLFVRNATDHSPLIGGVQIPNGSFIGIQTHTIHYSQQFYQNPYEFNPDRWLKQRKTQHPFSFIPFSGGQRNCIGQHLAKMQYKILLSKIINKFQFQTKEQMIMGLPFAYSSLHNKFTFRNRK